MGLPLKRIEKWNDRLHYYAGLVLLPFLMLFAFTGVLLNHPEWSFAEFWPNRQETTSRAAILAPRESADSEKARALMRQLGLSGELDQTTTYPDPQRFDFRVVRPGRLIEVRTDLGKRAATIKRTQTNGWGVVHMLHNFSGVRAGDPKRRNWWLTYLWSGSMDAVAIGLVLLSLSSLWMWWRQRQRRLLGLIVLIGGMLACGFFAIGLSRVG